MSVTFKVRNHVDSAQMKRDVAYSLTNLSDAMMQQASLLAHYGEISAKAARQVDDVKLLLENTEAAVDRKLRDEAAQAGAKTTEPQLEKSVSRHPKVIAMKKALNEAKQIEAIAKIAVEAFRHRRDMLVQEGATNRKEMEGELAIRVRQSRDELMEQTKSSILERRRPASE